MFHNANPYVQTFAPLREWGTITAAQDDFRMGIHEDHGSPTGHIRRYNGHSSSEVAEIIPGTEDGTFRRREIVLYRRDFLNAAGNEVSEAILVTLRPCDSLSYVFCFRLDMTDSIFS